MSQAINLPRSDPTQTTTLRSDFSSSYYKRFRKFKGALREGIEGNNALSTALAAPPDDQSNHDIPEIDPLDRFTGSVSEVSTQFIQWVKQSFRELFETVLPDPAIRAGRHFTAPFLIAGFMGGVNQGEDFLAKSGVDIDPVSQTFVKTNQSFQDRLQLVYQRGYNATVGVVDATRKELSRVITNALQSGTSKREIADRLTDQVDDIGIRRGRITARTEIIRAFNWGALSRYLQAGVDRVAGYAEFRTQDDDQVCERCRDLDGTRYQISEAWDIIPVHPRCRCFLLPVVS